MWPIALLPNVGFFSAIHAVVVRCIHRRVNQLVLVLGMLIGTNGVRIWAYLNAHENMMLTTQNNISHRSGSKGKRAANLTLSADVLESAKVLGINISQVCDAYLREVVRAEQERRWRQEHSDFISAYNSIVEEEGLPLDQWRSF